MTSFQWQLDLDQLTDTRMLAQILALKLRTGDVLALSGDLGAGKTTFARELIRSLAADPALEVPSPTYALMQVYETPRSEVRHYDLYRLASADELIELGFGDDSEAVISIVEWPERALEELPGQRIDLQLNEVPGDPDEARHAKLSATGLAAERLQRAHDIWSFIRKWAADSNFPLGKVSIEFLQGDASARSYARLRTASEKLILMDSPRQADGPPIRDGQPYSRIAHLAEDIQPFIAIGAELARQGCSVPDTKVVDRTSGLAVIEDLGDAVFGDMIAGGADILPLYRAASDVLLHLRNQPLAEIPESHGCRHELPCFDRSAFMIEIELFLDWYVPTELGQPLSDGARQAFLDAWVPQIERMETCEKGLVLRDFHSPNLLWLEDRSGIRQIGLIDYQDALIGHAAYDLVSLLQDARLDVACEIEAELLDYYCTQAHLQDSRFDEAQFRWAYALLGAQRNTKILGIFARLAARDAKPQYRRHIPRISAYLQRNLAHVELSEIRAWFEKYQPSARVRTT